MAYTRTYRVRTVAIGYITDTMGCMLSDAQFAGMTLGIGNNPMVGCTVACAVDVATALNYLFKAVARKKQGLASR